VVRVGNNISTPLILNTVVPQGCVLSPLLYSLFTHDCVAMHASNSIIKFADDITVVGLIANNDETAYREEVRALGVWCQENNLTLNVNKTAAEGEAPYPYRHTHHGQTEMVHPHRQRLEESAAAPVKTVWTTPPSHSLFSLSPVNVTSPGSY
jgi:hypothetical protein